MDTIRPHYEFEQPRATAVMPPLAEVFHDVQQFTELWPEVCETDPSITEQIEQHAQHSRILDEVIDRLPDPTMSLETAIETGLVNKEQVGRLYTALGTILEDPDYARLALYLPFEFLPDVSWNPEDKALQAGVEHFKSAYLKAWEDLLTVHDVRANFVDGDVIEKAYRTNDLPRVVKAAHLIPQLIDKGLYTEPQAVRLLHETNNPNLQQSIIEALEAFRGDLSPPETPADLPAEMITASRSAWLARRHQEEAMSAASRPFTEAVLEDELPPEVLAGILTNEVGSLAQAAFITGVYNAIETTAMTDTTKAEALTGQYSEALAQLWAQNNDAVRKPLARVYRRLHRLNLVDREELDRLGIELPRLHGQLSANLELFAGEVAQLKRITQAIEAHPELLEIIYPVALVGGSKLKGYGETESDVDVSVFIKPHIPQSARPQIRERLDSIFTHGHNRYEPIEVWLNEQANGGLHVQERLNPDDRYIADKYWTHTLFSAAWVGNEKAITALQQKLLPNYFYESEQRIEGQTVRNIYLEKMEQDLLQYRLMHHGYLRHYPRTSPPASKAIDGESMFWDSGYRQLATRLFVSKVFLPKITG